MYERGFRAIRDSQPDSKEEAVMILEAWRSFEQKAESSSAEQRAKALQAVERRMPKRIKRKRPVQTEAGLDAGMEVALWSERLSEDSPTQVHASQPAQNVSLPLLDWLYIRGTDRTHEFPM